MCRRILQFLLIVSACLCVLAVFVPWQRLFFLSDEQAVRCIAARMLLLPVFGLCIIGATWAAKSSGVPRSSHIRLRRTVPRIH